MTRCLSVKIRRHCHSNVVHIMECQRDRVVNASEVGEAAAAHLLMRFLECGGELSRLFESIAAGYGPVSEATMYYALKP